MSSKETSAKPNDSTDRSLNYSMANLEITSGNTFKMTKFQIVKNVLVVSIGFLFLFTSFQSLSNHQSSLNSHAGLWTLDLLVLDAALIVSCIFLTPVIITYLGCKGTVAISMLCYILYLVANFYATWGTIIPASIIVGLGAAPIWTAKCTYLTQAGVWYAKMTGKTEDDTINRFFGVFFMIFQTSQIWANLISSMVFSQRPVNSTHDVSSEDLLTCGANYDGRVIVNYTNLDKPDMDKIYTACGIYIACAVVAFLIIAIFLDQIVLDKDDEKDPVKVCPHLLVETFKHCWRSRYQKLIVPLTIYSGIEQAFIARDFTVSYVSCALGFWNVSFVMICFGVVDAACSFIFGRLVQYVGHIPFFVLAFIVHGGCQIIMLLWLPDPDAVYMFYILAALWGLGDAVIKTQINALYGFLFTKNAVAAFANYRMWESIGFIIAFGYSGYLLTRIKLYLCLLFLCVGMFFYGVIEVAYRRSAADKTYDDLQARGQTDENYSRINGNRDKTYDDLQARGQTDEHYSRINGNRDKTYEGLQARERTDENYYKINGAEDIPLESQPSTEQTLEKHCIAKGHYLQFYETLMEVNLSSGKSNFLHSFEDYLTRMNQDQTSRQYDYPSFISDEPLSKDGADAMDIYHLGENGRVCVVTATSLMTSDFWNNVVDNNITTIMDLDVEGDVDLNKGANISFKQVQVHGVNEKYLSGIRFVKLQLISGNKDRSVLYIPATFKLDEELLVSAQKLAIIYVHGVMAISKSAEQNILIHIKATSSGQHGIVYGVFSVLNHLDETGFFDLDESLKHTREKDIFEADTFEKFRLLHDAARLFILNPEGKENVN